MTPRIRQEIRHKKKLAKLEVHPGEVLLEEFMKPNNLDVEAVAKGTGLNEAYLNGLIAGDASVNSETSLCLGHFFNMSPEFWLNLQKDYDKTRK
ncbi:MAG: HigA family addiction module antidote protein [Candidatus Liptonbacteria bacterium]|nr:HigA family addiction module antidote protein [Candidatus Liptonbacteria bacterium]